MLEYCIDRRNALEIFSKGLNRLPGKTVERDICNKEFDGMCIHYRFGGCSYDPKKCKRGELEN